VNPTRPLVSCVLPTRDRPAFVAQAVRYFLRQDYPARELLVVDCGKVPLTLPSDPRIRHLRPDRPLTIGAARNLGCAAGRGELLAHWDDDDWIGADRLTRQVDAIRRADAGACGLASLLYYRPRHGDAWRYAPLAGDGPFLGGGTLLFRRSAWAAAPFPETDVGEDAAFVAGLDPRRLLALPDDGWYVALLHDGNSAPKHLADPRWAPASMDEVARRIEPDRFFYAAVRAGRLGDWQPSSPTPAAVRAPARPAGRPAAAAADTDAITVAGDLLVYDGLGSMTEYAALGLARAGADVRLAPIRLDTAGLAADTVRLLSRPAGDGPLLYWSWPRPELAAHLGRAELFIRTAWESSRLPGDWPALLNRACAVIVPSTYVADACRASGVTAPLAVVPDGVDPAVHGYQHRPRHAGVTTLVVGTLIARKHMAEAVAAWRRAFAGDPEARLLVKARFNAGRLATADPRIRVVDSAEPTRGLAAWYAKADVLLALGNEGFGLPLVEGMATGLPVIALHSEGQADVCREAGELVLSVPPKGFAAYDDPRYGRCGLVAVPDVDAVAARLRWVADHREEARDLGRAASRWALRRRSVWAMGPAVLDVMERHTRPPRALRRPRMLWVSSWERRCGVGEYTAELLRALPREIRVTARPPRRHGVRLLHVQHEDGLFDDAALARHLESVDAPVVVTEHSVWPLARAWERRADVLVALTDHGAAMLRGRAAGRRVVRLPHGCPTWFPPRKAARGRVIGAFGFLEAHKGLSALLKVVRALPGSELVLYSHARTPAVARDFAKAVEGLPVRWTDAFLPVETVARRLAADCDVLVFWYDEVPHASASGAARVGLATGVPVLTSPTGWFADLRDVTYQPADVLEGVRRLLDDSALRAKLSAAARDFCSQHAWRRVAAEHLTLWQSVESV
jgi:glycosyltransferase involved in cell wall biosynthesis